MKRGAAAMQTDLRDALAARLLAMADDELILGHRDSEWCGHAPILEEDIAFANIALDEIGHAILWYQIYAEVIGDNPETLPDELAYKRSAADFRNVQFVELPVGDWAFSMLRQYLFDVYESVMLERLAESHHEKVAGAAAKIRKEEIYHQRHTKAWVRRLGLGTKESKSRIQTALDILWPEALALFVPLTGDEYLAETWMVPRLAEMQSTWEAVVRPWLTEAGLVVPSTAFPASTRMDHTEYLTQLLDDLQEVTRTYPDVNW
jgi:ring-1,2-phenylacetyl-CoA epoxidase subunit PaaC